VYSKYYTNAINLKRGRDTGLPEGGWKDFHSGVDNIREKTFYPTIVI